ncbi:TonB-dependent receptor [Flavobacterium sp. Fl-77]|uniref:TonB-dependent receptor n=1 Tax=Flavobacterium flavipigmentatum TaxID=2893884 RepID=A0AAJ2S664_9FLAO|nr:MULTISPECIES: outer membrane beta-barrel protein [unclassified Flavobacterium]MDX6180677.1 TonB-dependent receptor [Flavobacterium sp. Fl-33]MDX6184277.1 TonB-dependent receptor [Flavobacterium sp. Fl-77]UFH39389.1 TonB-dependent receptor [Flavobacterium sp. F-70]
MKKKQLITICLFLIISIQSKIFSQITINGKIINTNDQPIEFAEILLLTKDSLVTKSELSNQDGIFQINEKKGNYILMIKQLGNVLFKKDFYLEENIELGTIKAVNTNSLQSVDIVTKKKLIKINNEKTIIDVDNSSLTGGSNLYDILKNTPNVIIDGEDNISLAGKSEASILIDDKLMTLSKKDLANTLRNIPSSNIKEIEIVINPSSKYDATSALGMINIKLKKNSKIGLYSNINSGWAYGRASKYYVGTSIGYNKDKLNVWGTYNYVNNTFLQVVKLDRTILNDNEIWQSKQNTNLDKKLKNNSYILGLEYEINKNHTVKSDFEYKLNNDKYPISGNTNIYINNEILSRFESRNTQNVDWNQMLFSTSYLGKLNNNGTEISSGITYLNNKDDSKSDIQKNSLNDSLMQNTVSARVKIISGQINLTQLLNKKIKLDFGGKVAFTKTSNFNNYYNVTNSNSLELYDYNDFNYNENVLAFYTGAFFDYKILNIKAGFRVEDTHIKNDFITIEESTLKKSNYTSFFPNFSLTYNLKNHILGTSYSKSIIRPNYDALNPYQDYLDDYTRLSGNTNLQPQITESYSISDTYKKINFSLNYIHTANQLNRLAKQDVESKEEIYMYENVKKANRFSSNISFPIKCYKWWDISNIISIYYDDYSPEVSDFPSKINGWGGYFQTISSFIFFDNFSGSISLRYMSPQVSKGGLYNIEETFSMDIGAKITFLKNRGVFKASVTDLFNTDRFKGELGSLGNSIKINNKWESRQIKFNIGYNIFESKQKDKKINTNSLEEERNRMKK